MPGFNNRLPCLHNDDSKDDATMTSPSAKAAINEVATFASSPSTAYTTTPTPKHLTLIQHDRQGKMYDSTKDLMDSLPPEILTQILLSFDKTTLLQCVTLSRRWASRVMPHLWYSPNMLYYASWVKLYQTLSMAAMYSVNGGGRGEEDGEVGGIVVGSNPHHATAAAAAAATGGGVMVTTKTTTTTTSSSSSQSMGVNNSQHNQPFRHPLRFPYNALIKSLDFSNLYYVLSDTLLSHILPLTPFLTTFISDAPKQFSDDALFTLAKYCPLLERLELWGCSKVSDKGMEAVARKCWRLKAVVLSNVVRGESEGGRVGGGSGGGGGGEGGVGNSSRASSSNHSLTLTHKTLDYLAMTSPSTTAYKSEEEEEEEEDTLTISTTRSMITHNENRKLYTLNLANGLRIPPTESTISEPSPSSLSLAALLAAHSNYLTTVNLSFCGPAVIDTTLAHFSPSLKHLNIAFCYEVTDTGLESLSRTSPDLQDLDISGVTQVTDKGILEIGYGCRGLKRLVMVDERYRSNARGAVGGEEGQRRWSTQNPLITDDVLSLFSWGARIIQRRDEMLGQKTSPRVF